MNSVRFSYRSFFIYVSAVVLIILLCCLNLDKLDYIAVLNDEFGYWGNAVSMVGYNWKELIAETPFYAWGYSIWLIPIIALFPTPESWYKIAIMLNILFLIGSYCLCCKIAKKLFANININIIYVIALIVIIYPSNIIYAQVAWSETLLYFLMWLATYILLSLDEKFSYRKSIGFIIVLIYMYMVHARTIGVVAVGIGCLFLIFLKNKRSFFNYFLVLLIIFIGYIANSFIKDVQIDKLWGNAAISSMNNVSLSSDTISFYLDKITKNIILFLESIGGKFIYLIISTGLTIVIAMVCFVKDEIVSIKNRKILHDKNIVKIWCFLSFFSCWVLCALQMMSWTDRKDIIVYSRYMENALGPVLLLGIIYAVNRIKENRLGVLLSISFLLIGMQSVYWRIIEAEGYFNSICSPVIGALYDFFQEDVQKTFICMIIICSLFFVILILVTFIKKSYIKYGITIICFCLYFSFLNVNGNIYMNTAREKFDSSTVPIKELITEKYTSQEIYYIKNDKDPYSVRPKYLQFLIPEKSIHLIEAGDLKNNLDDSIILANPLDCEALKEIENNDNIEFVLSTDQMNFYYSK